MKPGHFVSSFAWKQQSNLLVCTDSVGKVQILELVNDSSEGRAPFLVI
jgi:hypothetical protein